MSSPAIITGLSAIAPDYDAAVCDVWGVLHNGKHARAAAVDALQRFRKNHGPVVLLSNAPRPVSAVIQQFASLGVPPDCYDAIVTSGAATHDALAARAGKQRLALLHIGPERDRGVFEGLPIDCVDGARASLVLCTGLADDDNETPGDYRVTLAELRARNLVMLCANPDIVVQRGVSLVYCAGAIARVYEEMGGEVIYYGKPYLPVYEMTLARARQAAGREIARPLAIGDGLSTDILGANRAGLDALFIADGVHGEELGAVTAENLARLFAKAGVSARAAMPALVW
jgi:HAD superfamily hydrolase (TIGR01459 family)